MKKLYIILSLIVVSFLMVFAADTVKMLRIYYHGTFTAVPLPNIDSIDHSEIDSNGDLQTVIEAIDSTRRIPVSEIDSVVVTEADFQQTQQYIANIRIYLASVGEQPETQFKEQLMRWLNTECNFVNMVTLSESKSDIIVGLSNGMPLCISFINYDAVVSEDKKPASTRIMKASGEDQKLFDVSSISCEKIVNPNVLYVQGRSMPSKIDEKDYSNADAEWKALKATYDASPIKGTLKKISKSLTMLEEDYSQYGMLILSQTHGSNSLTGNFQVENYYQSEWWRKCIIGDVIPVITIFINQGICKYASEQNIYWVTSKGMRAKFRNNLVYASYCHSSYLGDGSENATIYGYSSPIQYHGKKWSITSLDWRTEWPSTDSLLVRCNRFFNGMTYDEAVFCKTYEVYGLPHNPILSKPGKQRLFSIETNDITSFNKSGCPIITGKVNGYDNLDKKKCQYKLFVRKGKTAFTPIDDDVTDYYTHDLSIDDKGRLECPYTAEMDVNTPYTFMFAIKYKENIYYSKPKTYDNALCPDDNHPHMIDLALPSGTKWACCNVGAHSPEEAGLYFAWGETENKAEYNWENYEHADKNDKNHVLPCINIGADISGTKYDAAYVTYGGTQVMPSLYEAQELEEYCWNPWTTYKGMGGHLFIGPSGNKIFMPHAGYIMKDETHDFDLDGYVWLSTVGTSNDSNDAFRMSYTPWYDVRCGTNLRYVGSPIRGVSKSK
jgi:hypothetical protein